MSDKKQSKKDNYTAVIIGAGRIAAGFDDSTRADILTHAHAYAANPRTTLGGFVDIRPDVAHAAAQKWKTRSFSTIPEACEALHPDIVSVCTPDALHAETLLAVLPFRPSLVIAEKPLTTSVEDSETVVRAYTDAGIPVIVNYSRRFDPAMQALRNEMAQGLYGKVIAVSGVYNKGIRHTGSHLIDLLRFFFGEVTSTQALTRVDDVVADPSIACFLQFERCPQVLLSATDSRRYEVFDLTIYCEKNAITIRNFGNEMSVCGITKDDLHPEFLVMEPGETRRTSLGLAMKNLIDHAVDCLDTGDASAISDITEAQRTQDVCEQLLQQLS